MKAGIIGYGSIGRRHAANLDTLGIRNITLLREKGRGNEQGFSEVYNRDEFLAMPFSFIIVSNPTTFHYETLVPLMRAGKNLLVEKPLVFAENEFTGIAAELKDYKGIGMMAYNMRFHPCVQRVAELLSGNVAGKPLSARFTVGQYLPDWRPGRDYSTGVSALKSLGGGVVLELIHEIDMAIHLLGKPASEVKSVALKISDLNIETEDISEIIWLSESNTLVSVHQDYLNRDYRRAFEIVCENGTIFCDMKEPAVRIVGEGGKAIIDERFRFERNDMYLSMMRYFTTCVRNGELPQPSLAGSLASVRVALDVKRQNNI